MPVYTDQLNNKITLHHKPTRIISLVPSQTELLADLGLEKEVIGITKFCVHPNEWFRNKQRIGGTKTINVPLIASLKPDLIIGNKEENIKEQVLALAGIAPVWVSDINNIDEALEMIKLIGAVTGKVIESNHIITQLQKDIASLSAVSTRTENKRFRTAYIIWKDPYMAAGGDTFINDMIQKCGWENVLSEKTRYPEISIKDLAESNTELLLLSSEPYPFRQKHIDLLREQLPKTKIILVDGEIFGWYGSRLLHAADYLKRLITGLPLTPGS